MVNLLLASQSPRRRELIPLLNYPVEVTAADVDEDSVTHPDPAVSAVQTAQLKTMAVAARLPHPTPPDRLILIASDTTVALEGEMFGKPADEADAWRMLRRLRGRTHHVYTGVTLLDVGARREITGVNASAVTMRAYSDNDIAAYVASGDPMDKAGAYAIQHPQFQPVARLEGCFLGVMGLSLCHLIQMLRRLDVPPAADLAAVHQAHQGYECPVYQALL